MVDRHERDSFTVRILVDGKLLLPECAHCPGAKALAYFDEALVDVRPEDQLSLRTEGDGGIRTFRAKDLEEARRCVQSYIEADSSSSGIRRAVDSPLKGLAGDSAGKKAR